MNLKEICEEINSPARRDLRLSDYDRFIMFEGHGEQVIKKAIIQEFKKPESIEELIQRIIPINLIQKIVTKLAGVYIEDPERRVVDQNDDDQILLDNIVYYTNLNKRMMEANRYFKLFKRNLMEIYYYKNIIKIRNLPRHTYEVFGTTEEIETVVKILKDGIRSEQIFEVWTNELKIKCTGEGVILEQEENYARTLPFIYTNSCSYSLDPLPDDDLLRCAIVIPLMLTDLALGAKYQCWSTLWTIGDVGEVSFHPASIVSMNYDMQGNKPEIGMIKPQIDIVAMLQLITNILSTLLTTKGLSTATISTTLTVGEATSGISKMLDNADATVDIIDQQSTFYITEVELWKKMQQLLPYYRQIGLIDELNAEFSEAFDVNIIFKTPKPIITDREKVEVAKLRLDAKLSTIEKELRFLYPTLIDQEIEDLENEIQSDMENRSDKPIQQNNNGKSEEQDKANTSEE